MEPSHLVSSAVLFTCAVVCGVLADVDDRRQYTGYSLLRLVPTTNDHMQYLLNLSEGESSDLDFWHPPSHLLHPVDLMLSANRKKEILRVIKEKNIPQSLIIQDVERLIQQTQPLADSAVQLYSTNQFFTDFRRVDEIQSFLSTLASENPDIATVFSIGNSSEHRSLMTIKISKPSEKLVKPAVWIMGGIHAREWISPATAVYFIAQLVEGYGKKDGVTQLVDDYEWYILPVANPDGYEYSHTADRLWRKTRSESGSLFGCRGVDANRNFDVHWGEPGSSIFPCSQTYEGHGPGSEPEVKAIQDFITALNGSVEIFVDLHSYSQKLLTPYGWTRRFPSDYDLMKSAGESAIQALTEIHGTKYRIGTSSQLLYRISGNSNDWAYDKMGVTYSYCFELRDTGRYGFLLPRDQILPTAEETWAAMMELANLVRRRKIEKSL